MPGRKKRFTVSLAFLARKDLEYLQDYTGQTAETIVAGLLSKERHRIEFAVEQPEINPITMDETPMEQWQRDSFDPSRCG